MLLVEHPDSRFWLLETFIEEFAVYLVTQGRTKHVLSPCIGKNWVYEGYSSTQNGNQS